MSQCNSRCSPYECGSPQGHFSLQILVIPSLRSGFRFASLRPEKQLLAGSFRFSEFR